MRYSTVIKQIFIIAKSKWFVQLLKGKLFSIASFEVLSNLKKMVPDLNYIIDVGANSGQFSQAAIHFYPNAKVDIFEPLPNQFSKIETKFRGKSNISTFNLAMGNEEGTISFFQNNYGHISSVLEINSDNIHYPKSDKDLNQIEVKISTLDNFLDGKKIPSPSLLKLDVQGYELEVIKGAEGRIQEINYLIIEANLEQLYKDQPSFTEINTYLNERNFELEGMLDFNLGIDNRYIEIDLLYKNKAL